MVITLAGLVLLSLGQAASIAPARPAPPPGLSWEDADALATTLKRVNRRLRSGRPAATDTLVVTERQLNSYLVLHLALQIPPEVAGLRVSLGPGWLEATATVDLDRVKARLPSGGASLLLALLSGPVPVALRGRLPSGEGKGRVEVEEAVVGGVSLPASMVAELVAVSTRSPERPQGVDILTPFDLPWSLQRVRFEKGRALLDFHD